MMIVGMDAMWYPTLSQITVQDYRAVSAMREAGAAVFDCRASALSRMARFAKQKRADPGIGLLFSISLYDFFLGASVLVSLCRTSLRNSENMPLSPRTI